MKTRNGFVSNSSSSSFIVLTEYLSPFQTKAIKSPMSVFTKLCREQFALRPDDRAQFFSLGLTVKESETLGFGAYKKAVASKQYIEHFSWWNVDINEESITCSTTMDNFDFQLFIEALGVPDNAIEIKGW